MDPTTLFLRRVTIRNYKSIGNCRVELAPLTLLVGRNSAGKSNFLDALRFVSDSLTSTLDQAFRSRGGIDAVRRRSTGHPRNFAIELELTLPDWRQARYGFEIASRPKSGFAVKREVLRITKPNGEPGPFFSVDDGRTIESSEEVLPPSVSDRLFLVNAGGLPAFYDVFASLSAMGFYNLNPEVMKAPQSPDAGEILHRDGSNIASVIARLKRDRPAVMDRVIDYLRTIVPGIAGVEQAILGPTETLRFRQEVKGSKHPWQFYAISASDGTLRSLGILVAVMQLADHEIPIPLVGIEEPETALHPAAAGALMDALAEAASHTQILVSSHSGVLLDEVDIDKHRLLIVLARQGKTEIATIDEASKSAIQNHLYTAGDLQRMDQLEPDLADLAQQEQLSMFEFVENGP